MQPCMHPAYRQFNLNMRHLDISPIIIIAPYKFFFCVYIKTLYVLQVIIF